MIHEVGASRLGQQFDVYHRQRVRGEVIRRREEFIPLIRNMQLANPPDCGESNRGELDYRSIFEAVVRVDYQGRLGCEYTPRAGTALGLAFADRLGVAIG